MLTLIFEFTQSFKETDINNISDNHTVAFLSASEFEEYHNKLGISDSDYKKYMQKGKSFRSETEVHHSYIYGTIRTTEPDINSKNEALISFCFKKKLILLIETAGHSDKAREYFIQSVHRFSEKKYSPEQFIAVFIDTFIRNDGAELESIEFGINNIEDRIINEAQYKNFNEEMLSYKRKLLRLRNYYEQFIDIGEVLAGNESGIFQNTVYFRNFIRKAERLCDDVNLLRDGLVQLRDTYQSHLDQKLNNTMKLFTVITAFFSPLTLIAGWYGMNFKYMPELNWRYGYAFVIALSIASVIGCLIIFKRKKMI